MNPNVQKQPRPQPAVETKNSPSKMTIMMPVAASSADRTRERAYELYVSRGRESGQDVQDWLRAEQEILKRER